MHTLIDQYVKDKCGRWKGGYLTPEYQIVTDEDARGTEEGIAKGKCTLGFTFVPLLWGIQDSGVDRRTASESNSIRLDHTI